MSAPLITLTTDFGAGAYVAQMKGVLISALPEARIVDVTHAIAPRSVRQAETMLRSTAFCFPLGTVHVVVVDPGVGTERRALAVRSRGHIFVGPDNGVLGIALAQPDARCVVLDRPELFQEPVSPTFHGRDVFAPIAAELAGGLGLVDVGTPIDDAQPSILPEAVRQGDNVLGETLLADPFGNLLTNIPAEWVRECDRFFVDGQQVPRVDTYGRAESGELICLVGSDQYLEIAVSCGSAADTLGASEGLVVRCETSNRR